MTIAANGIGALPVLIAVLGGTALAKAPAESLLRQPDAWFRSGEGVPSPTISCPGSLRKGAGPRTWTRSNDAMTVESCRLTGIRIERVTGERTLSRDTNAPPIWARASTTSKTADPFSPTGTVSRSTTTWKSAANAAMVAPGTARGGLEVQKAYAQWKEKQRIKALPPSHSQPE
jgi:hypothetical protein